MVSLERKIPAWGVSRWGSRGLRFIPPDDEGFSVRGDKQRLEYKGRQRSHRFTILDDTAFEYDVILNGEPENNIVTLRMEGAENFDFIRQPDFVSDPFLKGSYAVYRKETLLGQGTGKLCHIHRPLIIDAKGRRVWGELSVVGNELRIAIPEKWLGRAAYPVVVDPIIGTTTIGSQEKWDYDPPEPWEPLSFEISIPVNRFTVTETVNGLCTAFFHTNVDDGSAGGRPVIYSDNFNQPHQRRSSNENFISFRINANNPRGWRSGTFQVSESISSGTSIWFGCLAEHMWLPRFDYGAAFCEREPPFGAGIPNIYPGYTGQHRPLSTYTFRPSMYFEYSTAQNYVRTLTQGVDLSDKININWFHQRLISNVSKIADQAIQSIGHLRKNIENVKANDLVNRSLFFIARIVSGVHIRDFVTNHFLKSNTEVELKSAIQREIVLGGNAFINSTGMGKIFKGQSALRMMIKTFVDLEGIEKAVIKYRKPNGRKGEFTAAVGDTAQGIIFHECIEGDIDASGWWAFWAFITFEDGRTASGQAVKVFIWEEGC